MVQDSAVEIVEASHEEQEPDPEMGDVRHRDDDEAAGREIPVELHEDAQRIDEVLEHVAVHDDVERLSFAKTSAGGKSLIYRR
jgi:hypothetical protein